MFDKRGTGLSDRVRDDQLPTLEERMDDLHVVMDAAGSERTALFGFSEGGSLSALFAATYPERTTASVMYGTFAKRIWSQDYPWAPTPEERQKDYEFIEREWGNLMDLEHYVPSMVDNEAAAPPAALKTNAMRSARRDGRARPGSSGVGHCRVKQWHRKCGTARITNCRAFSLSLMFA